MIFDFQSCLMDISQEMVYASFHFTIFLLLSELLPRQSGKEEVEKKNSLLLANRLSQYQLRKDGRSLQSIK